MNREVDDIDSRDSGNPLLCTGYVSDLYEHFHQMEREFRVSGRYMEGQELVNEKMRGILVDWLVSPIKSTYRIARIIIGYTDLSIGGGAPEVQDGSGVPVHHRAGDRQVPLCQVCAQIQAAARR